ncbi:MAG TPA: GHMP kinase [Lachnospiraceae bacterium]|nr:GHMP kinase [Lachnospiraceae bacterium]
MLITKTPFRISFCGGGSDMPDFYRKNGGCVLSTSIDKYMYISIHPYFDEEKIALKYSENEIVTSNSQIKHSIFKQVLSDYNINGVELVSTADVPSGTGLGSSSSFTVGLIHTLNCYQGKYMSKKDIAKEACEVEINKLGSPIGKQDQYAAACGGLNFITFHKDDTVSVEPVIMRKETMNELQENLVMFYTGIKHDANIILDEQKNNISQSEKTKNLLMMCNLAKDMKESLESNDLSDFGNILHENWILKKELAGGITRPEIDYAYNKALKSGAIGGKLLGAGGGGFLLFYCKKGMQKKLEENLGLKKFDFSFERDGTSVIYIGEKYW